MKSTALQRRFVVMINREVRCILARHIKQCTDGALTAEHQLSDDQSTSRISAEVQTAGESEIKAAVHCRQSVVNTCQRKRARRLAGRRAPKQHVADMQPSQLLGGGGGGGGHLLDAKHAVAARS